MRNSSLYTGNSYTRVAKRPLGSGGGGRVLKEDLIKGQGGLQNG